MFVLIENRGELPIQGFILGASTSRGEPDKIGQFGSGSLFAVLTLLRHGVKFYIYSGEDLVDFYVEDDILSNKVLQVVKYRYRGKEYNTGTCLEFGEIDWTTTDMALREFISNAIDQDSEVCKLSLKKDGDEIRGEKGCTRVYVEWTPSVRAYIENIDKYFLHFSYQEKKKYIPNTEDRGPRIYRRGVFVRELPKQTLPAKYDYNFQDMPIDECRNLNDYEAKALIGQCLEEDSFFVEMVEAHINKNHCWETECLGPSYIPTKWGKEWRDKWNKHFGSLLIARDSVDYEYAISKGQSAVILKGWYLKFKSNGVPHVNYEPLNLEKEGFVISEAEGKDRVKFNEVWNTLERLGLTNGRPKPEMKTFFGLSDNSSVLCGEYKDGTVYIHTNYVNSTQIILEELCHHITESYDGSRSFQDFAFYVAARVMDQEVLR